MKIAVLGAGRVGSTIGRLWHAAGHDVTFTARHATRPRAMAAELGDHAHAAPVADAVAAADVVLVAVPGPAVTDALQAAGRLGGRIMLDAANSFGQQQQSLRSLTDAFPRARWVRAFNSLSINIMADDNHREPPWVLFLPGRRRGGRGHAAALQVPRRHRRVAAVDQRVARHRVTHVYRLAARNVGAIAPISLNGQALRRRASSTGTGGRVSLTPRL